jgi:hypothetical protein
LFLARECGVGLEKGMRKGEVGLSGEDGVARSGEGSGYSEAVGRCQSGTSGMSLGIRRELVVGGSW